MITTPSLLLALCFALPGALAGSEQPPPEQQPPEQPPPTTQPSPTETEQPRQQGETDTLDPKMHAKVQASVWAAALGIHMGDIATGVLTEMASIEPLERSSVREVVALADQGVQTAHKSAKELHKMKALGQQERAEAKRATDKLDEAQATIRRMKQQVGTMARVFDKTEADNVRTGAMRLRSELGDAQKSIQQIAEAHQVELQMEPSERSAARSN